jgi:putative ABC transport system substrate-binding protein
VKPVLMILGLVIGMPGVSMAQQTGDMLRIGFLRAEAPDNLIDSFRDEMHHLGYIAGHNLVIEQRWAYGQYDKLPELAADLVRMKVDMIVTASTPASLAAKRASSTVPIIIAASADPVANHLVASLAHPGGNITGFTIMLEELAIKRLEVLKETVPRLSCVTVLWSAANPAYEGIVEQMKRAAPGLKLRMETIKVITPGQLQQALAKVTQLRCDSLYVFEDAIFRSNGAAIAQFALKAHLPSIYGGKELLSDGGMMSYGPNYPDLFRRAALVADRIFKGAKPGDLPIEQPTKFELVVNLKTAKALGIKIPESVLLRADEVIR